VHLGGGINVPPPKVALDSDGSGNKIRRPEGVAAKGERPTAIDLEWTYAVLTVFVALESRTGPDAGSVSGSGRFGTPRPDSPSANASILSSWVASSSWSCSSIPRRPRRSGVGRIGWGTDSGEPGRVGTVTGSAEHPGVVCVRRQSQLVMLRRPLARRDDVDVKGTGAGWRNRGWAARVRVLVPAAGVDQVHELVTDSDFSGGRAPSNRAVKGRRERG
jgi:hypothetical protein